ncbi:MAG: transposase [Planctomycetes bacterium]|nr:transposase [Planctomycetota bacterium]
MAQPRRLLDRSTYLVTRRVLGRQFRLKPSEKVNQILLYCLAYAADSYDIKIHAFCFLSNHYHLVLTDPYARLPEFMGWLNKYTAKCINALHGDWGVLWEPGSYSSVTLGDAEAVLDKILYTLCNPVEAELVPRGSDGGGLRTDVSEGGCATYEVERPQVFFRKNGPMPKVATLRLARVESFQDLSASDFEALLAEGVRLREEAFRRGVKKRKRAFFGWRGVVKQNRLESPATYEVRRGINPRLACRDKWKRIELLGTLKEFLKEYREALGRFLSGKREAVFPAGTYLMRVRFGVACSST